MGEVAEHDRAREKAQSALLDEVNNLRTQREVSDEQIAALRSKVADLTRLSAQPHISLSGGSGTNRSGILDELRAARFGPATEVLQLPIGIGLGDYAAQFGNLSDFKSALAASTQMPKAVSWLDQVVPDSAVDWVRTAAELPFDHARTKLGVVGIGLSTTKEVPAALNILDGTVDPNRCKKCGISGNVLLNGVCGKCGFS